MSDMSEVGVAAVRIVPVAKGFSADITRQIGSELASAAKKAGADAGEEIARGVTKAAKKAGADAGDALTAGLKGMDWPAPTGLPKAVADAARRAGDDAADALADSVKSMDWPRPTGLARELVPAARRAGDEAGEEMAEGIADGIDDGQGRIRSAVDRVGDVVKTGLAAAAVAAGALVAVGISGALEQGALRDKFEASLGFPAEAAERMGDIAGNLYLEGFGDSIADTGEVVRRVLQNGLLPEDATDAQIERLSTKILTFSDVMAQDMDMTTQAVRSMIKSGIADSSDEALDILTAGLQQGGDKAGDLLETFQEYSTSFRDIGISAEDATGLMIQGLGAGARDADKVADALKEVAIRAQDGSATTAEGFRLLGLNADEMTAKFAAGGDAARDGLDQILDGLREIKDPAERNAAAVALFGTQAEDLGDALFALDLDTAAGRLGDFAGSTDELGSAYDNAATRIEVFKRKALDKLITFVGNTAIPFLERLAEVVGPVLSAAVEELVDLADDVSAFWATLTTGFTEDEGTPVEEWALRIRDAFDWVPGVVEDLELFWAALTTGSVEGGGSPIEDFALALRDLGDWLSENEEVMIGALAGIGAVILATVVPAMVALAASTIAAAAPFILIGVAIAGLVAGILWLYNNVESFRTLVETALPIIQQIFSSVFDILSMVVTTTVDAIVWAWEAFGQDLIDIATVAWETISAVVIGALNIISGVVTLISSLMQGDWEAAWQAMQGIVSAAMGVMWALISGGLQLIWNVVQIWWSAFTSFWSTMLAGIVADVRGKIDTIVGFFQSLPGRVGRAIASLADAMAAPFRRAFGAIKSAWNSTVGGFSVSIPGVLGFGGASFTIPSMHTGGIVGGPPGSDQVRMLQAGEGVFTRDQMAAIGSAPAAAAPVWEPVLRVDGGDRELVRMVQKWIRNNGGGNVQTALGTYRG